MLQCTRVAKSNTGGHRSLDDRRGVLIFYLSHPFLLTIDIYSSIREIKGADERFRLQSDLYD